MLLLTGALTSKPYAFTSRPWELRSAQSIDIFDGIGSNIRIDFKETEIVRILPRKNSEINENWISDKIRFFYDGIKRQRLVTPYLKTQGKLTPILWKKVNQKVISLLKVFSFEYGSSKIGILSGSSLDTETLYGINDFLSSYGFINLGFDKPWTLDNENPQNYKFQTNFQDIENVDFCLAVGTNPRFEASLLNVRLRKMFRRGNLSISSIGGNFQTTFPINFLSLSTSTLLSIAEGKHSFCKLLTRAKNPMFLYSSNILERFDCLGLQNIVKFLTLVFTKVLRKTLTSNILHTDSNSVGALELGFLPFKKDKLKDLKIIYCIGVENGLALNQVRKKLPSSVLIFQNSVGSKTASLADIILPSTTFVEQSGVYYNTEGRPQRTQRALIGPKLSRDNWKIVRFLSSVLNKSSLYTTKSQLKYLISRKLPSFYYAGFWFEQTSRTLSSSFRFGEIFSEIIGKSSLKLLMEDFFMTHSLCYSSRVMAKASESLRFTATNFKFLDSFSVKS